MPETMKRYISGNLQERADQQFEPLCTGTGLFVMHSDIKTVAVTPTDPYSTAGGTNTGDSKIILIENTERLPWLELYQLGMGNAFSTAVSLRAFGLIPFDPRNQDGDLSRLLPQDLSATFPEPIPVANSPYPRKDYTGYWIPLKQQGQAAPAVIAFDTTDMSDTTLYASGVHMRMTSPRYVYVAGARVIMCVPSIAAVGPTAAMLLGRFSL